MGIYFIIADFPEDFTRNFPLIFQNGGVERTGQDVGA